MKKVIGQTVRDLKREVNKKVLKVPGIEQKVLDATNNEAWGPHGSLLAQLAQASRNYHEYQMIMNVIWKRINDTGKNWRHVYKALTVLEYLVAYGSERVIEEIREHAYQISTLSNFQYIDSNGRDQGSNVRRKSQSLVSLVNDKERVQEVRQKASANKDKYHSEGRHGYKDDDRNENEKNDDRHTRGRNSYDRDGDRSGRDNEEQNERDGYRNDDYGGRGSVEYQQGSRRSVDRYTDHCVDDDDRYSSRSGGGRGDDHPHNERRLEQHLSQENVCAPPTYEEATRVAQNHTQNEMDGEAGASPTDGLSSHAAPKATSPTGSVGQGPDHVVSSESPEGASKEFNGFVEFDPRGPVSAAPPSATSPELDFFGSLSPSESTNSMALIPSPSHTTTTNSEAAMPINSGFGLDFGAPSAAFTTNENPFGEDSPFKAFPQENFQSHPQSFPPSEPFPPVAPNAGHVPGFDFGDMLGGLSYTTNSEMPAAQAVSDVLDGILPRTDSATVVSPQGAQHADPTEPQGPQMNFPSHSGFSDMFPQQAGPNNMESGHLSFLQQQGIPQSASFPAQTAPVPPQATQPAIPYNMPPDHLNFLQQQGVSQSAPLPSQVAQPASTNSMPPSHLDFHQPQGAPLSAPFPTQATQPAPPNSMQPGHLNFLQQQGASVSAPSSVQAAQPTPSNNMQPPQMNFLQQQGTLVSAPVSSQAAQPASPNNMQPPQMNFLQQGASVSAPVSSQAAQPAPPNNMQPPQMNLLQQPGGSTPASLPPSQSAPPNNMQLDHFNMFQQPPPPAPQAAPAFSFGQPAKSQPTKFEPKSRVWADTLNRGLVDLNISGPKTNPLSDIGIDFDAINRKEKRKEAKSSAAPVASTITMGKAMGAGSGVGRAGASGLAPAPNSMMGSGMGMGGGGGGHMAMGGGMGMGGYGGGMNQPSMGMNMGMVQGAQMGMPNGMPPPGSGMPGMGYNPMMGMGNYGPPQQPYGGGPPQQPYGGGPPQQPYGGGLPQQQYGGGPPQQPYGGGYR